MRITFVSENGATLETLAAGFAPIAEPFGMEFTIHDATSKMKVVVMVSSFGHCLNDLLYSWRIEALPINIAAVVSNHLDYQKVVVNHDIPFHFIKVTRKTSLKPRRGSWRWSTKRRRTDRARALHAGPVRQAVPEDVGADHQHPPLVPAELQRRQSLQAGATSAA